MSRFALLFVIYISLLQCPLYQTRTIQQDNTNIHLEVPVHIMSPQLITNKVPGIISLSVPYKNRKVNIIVDFTGAAELCTQKEINKTFDVTVNVNEKDKIDDNGGNQNVSTFVNTSVDTFNGTTYVDGLSKSSAGNNTSLVDVSVSMSDPDSDDDDVSSSVSSNSTVVSDSSDISGLSGGTDSSPDSERTESSGTPEDNNSTDDSGSTGSKVSNTDFEQSGTSGSTEDNNSTGDTGSDTGSEPTETYVPPEDNNSTGNSGSTENNDSTQESTQNVSSGSPEVNNSTEDSELTGGSDLNTEPTTTTTADSQSSNVGTGNSNSRSTAITEVTTPVTDNSSSTTNTA